MCRKWYQSVEGKRVALSPKKNITLGCRYPGKTYWDQAWVYIPPPKTSLHGWPFQKRWKRQASWILFLISLNYDNTNNGSFYSKNQLNGKNHWFHRRKHLSSFLKPSLVVHACVCVCVIRWKTTIETKNNSNNVIILRTNTVVVEYYWALSSVRPSASIHKSHGLKANPISYKNHALGRMKIIYVICNNIIYVFVGRTAVSEMLRNGGFL